MKLERQTILLFRSQPILFSLLMLVIGIYSSHSFASIDPRTLPNMPEVFAKHPDPAIAFAWDNRKNKYMLERIFRFVPLGWNKEANTSDLNFVKFLLSNSSKSTPSYHWILMHSLPQAFRGYEHIKENDSLNTRYNDLIDYQTQKPLWYLVQGMWAFKNQRYHSAEKSFLTSLFLASNFSPKDAQKVGLKAQGSNQETNAISYTEQYLKITLPAKEKTLKQMMKAFDKQSHDNLMIGNWNAFFLSNTIWILNNRHMNDYAKYVNNSLEISYFRKFKKYPRIRGAPGNIFD